MTKPEAVDSPAFNLEEALLKAVMPYGQVRTYGRGTDLILMGEPSECFYYVEQGTLEVSYTAHRTRILVALIGPGAFFGEIGFFDQQTRTRNIQASENAHLRLFDREAMERLRADDPLLYARFLERVLRMVCGRFRQILSDRGPLTAYAASLSTGREHFAGLQPLPMDLLASPLWQQVNAELEEFKARMFDLGYKLQADPEADIAPPHRAEGEALINDFFQKVRETDAIIQARESAELIWGYVFKEVFPYLMRSRFFERAYYKPKGYAGDFYMIEMIYRHQAEGDGKLGRLLDGLFLDQVAARAVRGRRRLLHQTLDRLCRERLDGDGPIRILNLACGPCRELFDVIAQGGYDERIEALCVDIDAEALQFADRKVNVFEHRATVRFMHENVIKWALGRVKQDFGPQDIIYSSGLCDYLDARLVKALIKRCHDQLKPGGVLILGNFSPVNPDRPIMDHLLYWRLIHRDPEQLSELFEETPFGRPIEILSETQGVNLFALARRPVP